MRQSAALLLFCLASAEISIQATSPGFVDFDRRAKAGERLNVVFFGGSLTWGANASDPQISSWRAVVAQRLEVEYPKGRFKFWDASLGGAGALVGVFRLERDVLRRKPDLLFIDFAVADGIADLNPEEIAAHEAIVSRIVQSGHAAVVQLVLPYKRDVMRGNTDGMKGRDVVIDTARRYHLGLGDAMVLCQEFVKVGRVTAAQLWPFESNFPGDKAHDLFADAAWRAFMEAIQSKRVCSLPPKIRYADTYMTTARVRFSSLGPAPAGWRVGLPNPIGASFDMSMSRWMGPPFCTISAGSYVPENSGQSSAVTVLAKARFSSSFVANSGRGPERASESIAWEGCRRRPVSGSKSGSQ